MWVVRSSSTWAIRRSSQRTCARKSFLHRPRGGLSQPLPFRSQHLNQLAAASDEGGQHLRGGIAQGPYRRVHVQAKGRQYVRIDDIGLREAAESLRKGPHLARIHDRDQ